MSCASNRSTAPEPKNDIDQLRRSAAEGDGGSIEVLGGTGTDFVDDLAGVSTPRKSRNNRDELDESGDEGDDGDDEAVGEEDGVNAAPDLAARKR